MRRGGGRNLRPVSMMLRLLLVFVFRLVVLSRIFLFLGDVIGRMIVILVTRAGNALVDDHAVAVR